MTFLLPPGIKGLSYLISNILLQNLLRLLIVDSKKARRQIKIERLIELLKIRYLARLMWHIKLVATVWRPFKRSMFFTFSGYSPCLDKYVSFQGATKTFFPRTPTYSVQFSGVSGVYIECTRVYIEYTPRTPENWTDYVGVQGKKVFVRSV